MKTWSRAAHSAFMKTLSQFNDKTLTAVFDRALSLEPNADFTEECLPAKLRSNATIEFNQMIPGIMHLLFLGITRALLNLIIALLKTHRKYAEFVRAGTVILKEVRALSLQFCKAWAFGSLTTPTGPWVSENCLGFARCMKSVYSVVGPLLSEWPEQLLLVRKAIWSYAAVVARVMQDKYTSHLVEETECYIKVFLSDIEYLDSHLRGNSKRKPRIETTGNLIYLLRLPEFMRDFGPLREFWEGGIRGEGIFRYLKPLVRKGVHNPGVPQALLSKYYSDLFLTWILDDRKMNQDNDEDDGDMVDDETKFLCLSKRYSDIHTSRSGEVLYP
ncbi:MAG: hypothetical protein SGARI_000048 [Bacillariaceae sp.]